MASADVHALLLAAWRARRRWGGRWGAGTTTA